MDVFEAADRSRQFWNGEFWFHHRGVFLLFLFGGTLQNKWCPFGFPLNAYPSLKKERKKRTPNNNLLMSFGEDDGVQPKHAQDGSCEISSLGWICLGATEGELPVPVGCGPVGLSLFLLLAGCSNTVFALSS